jgi:adenylate cyclase
MAKVFLSYSRDDVDCVRQMAELLAEAGHQVWWDQHIQGGSRFSTAIDQALKDAEAVVVIWSPKSVQSAWVQDEAAEGRDSGRLVPVIIGETKPPLGFRQFQSIDLSGWNGGKPPAQFAALFDAIAQLGGAEEVAPRAPDQPAAAAHKASICVLPFVNMSGDPEQEYFSDGISEDIITDLSKVSALRVIARNSAFNLKGRSIDIKEVAEMFSVSYVLEGSVRKAGDRVRITAQLIDGKGEDHVWADRYDRDLTDIFAIQDEISKAIVAALRVKLLPNEKKAIETRGTNSVDAYNLYLMARQHWITGSFGDIRRDESIVRICKQALSYDPDYAQPWALMALAQAQLRLWHGKDVNALPAAEKALALNPNLAEAHCVKAQVLEEEGKTAEALQEVEEALRLDPESWEVNREAARLTFRQGRIREAAVFFEKAASLMDSDWHNPLMLITCYQGLGDESGVRKAAVRGMERAEKAIAKDPANASALACGANALALLGEHGRARDWIERALLLDPDNLIMRYNLACALSAHLKDADRAIDVLQAYFETTPSPTHIKHLAVDPDLDYIRDDPRFQKLLAAAKERLGMSTAAQSPVQPSIVSSP